MNLKTYLFKPAWQNKDAEARAEAVAHGSEPELLAELPALCLQDEDERVRMAAARRLRELPVLIEAVAVGRGPLEQRLLEERIRALASSTGADRPPLEQRLAVAASSQDRALLEALARHAPEPELRRAALQRVDQQGLLGDVAIHDPDPDIRQAAAARIHQHSTLLRVIEATRKTDKTLHAALTERLRTERLAAGDPATVAQEAQRICSALEALLLERPAEPALRRAELLTQWQAIADLAPAALRQRFDNDLQRLDKPAAPAAPEAEVEVQPEAPALVEQAAPVTPEPGPEPEPDPTTALESEPETPPAAAEEASPAVTKKQPWPPLPDELEAGFKALEAHLEAGTLAPALAQRAQLLEAGKPFKGHPGWRRLQAQLARLDGRLRELRDWQHWANNKQRKQMIAELEALPGSGLHPDAVLARLKELQAQWKVLEQGEQIPGDKRFSAAPGLWRRFNAAGKQAFDATKPFLDKRSEVQQRLAEELRSVAAQLKELAASEAPDWDALRAAISAGARSMRNLGDLPPHLRNKAASRLKRALDQANERTRAHLAELEALKRGLIRQAAQLAAVAQRSEAIASAKALQAQWTATGSLARGPEQKLWKEFRAHIDPLFAAVQAEHDNRRTVQQEARKRQQELCSALQAIVDGDPGQLAGHKGQVQGLSEAWRELSQVEPRLRQKFQALLDAYQQGLRAQAQRAKSEAREHIMARAASLHRLERAAAAGELSAATLAQARQQWPESAGGELAAALDARLAALESDPASCSFDPARTEQARLLAIQLEFLAGLPSPEEDRALRMRYQVDRLAQTLSGDRQSGAADEEARQLEQEWLLLGPLPAADYAQFEARIRAALKAI